MLLDDLMPSYDVSERYRTIVRATPEHTFAAIHSADLAGGALTRVLLGIRMLPAALTALVRSPRNALAELRARRAERSRQRLGLEPFQRAGFRIIAERSPDELVIGLLGRFWTPRGGLCPDVSEGHFAAGPPSGQALAGWNFTVQPRADGSCELVTETRVWCAPDARPRFRAYWLVVRPGSGLIRRAMLRAIRREAERRSQTDHPQVR